MSIDKYFQSEQDNPLPYCSSELIDHNTPEKILIKKDSHRELYRLIDSIANKNRITTLLLRHGFFNEGKDISFKEVGKKKGISGWRAWDLYYQALHRFNHPSRRKKMQDLLGEF